mmetsp:Transcript_6716/g.20724  ORF Transcript_6716/g.20724 Transcript_6716/m.20724 type:complete len:750 (-) Transcript_6716:628-2877(-)
MSHDDGRHAGVRHRVGDQLPECEPERVDVSRLGLLALHEHLRCHVAYRALERRRHVRLLAAQADGHPKIHDLGHDAACIGRPALEHHVGRFQVCVHNLVEVQVHHALCDVGRRLEHRPHVEAGRVAERPRGTHGAQAAAVAVFQHQLHLVRCDGGGHFRRDAVGVEQVGAAGLHVRTDVLDDHAAVARLHQRAVVGAGRLVADRLDAVRVGLDQVWVAERAADGRLHDGHLFRALAAAHRRRQHHALDRDRRSAPQPQVHRPERPLAQHRQDRDLVLLRCQPHIALLLEPVTLKLDARRKVARRLVQLLLVCHDRQQVVLPHERRVEFALFVLERVRHRLELAVPTEQQVDEERQDDRHDDDGRGDGGLPAGVPPCGRPDLDRPGRGKGLDLDGDTVARRRRRVGKQLVGRRGQQKAARVSRIGPRQFEFVPRLDNLRQLQVVPDHVPVDEHHDKAPEAVRRIEAHRALVRQRAARRTKCVVRRVARRVGIHRHAQRRAQVALHQFERPRHDHFVVFDRIDSRRTILCAAQQVQPDGSIVASGRFDGMDDACGRKLQAHRGRRLEAAFVLRPALAVVAHVHTSAGRGHHERFERAGRKVLEARHHWGPLQVGHAGHVLRGQVCWLQRRLQRPLNLVGPAASNKHGLVPRPCAHSVGHGLQADQSDRQTERQHQQWYDDARRLRSQHALQQRHRDAQARDASQPPPDAPPFGARRHQPCVARRRRGAAAVVGDEAAYVGRYLDGTGAAPC